MRKIFLLSLICISVLSSNNLFAQTWRIGGNNDVPGLDGLLSNSNFFGAKQIASVRLGTSNVSRIFIGGTNYTNPGFIGIGTNYLNPNHLLDIRDGDINTGNGTNASPQGYMIGDNYVLRHNALTTCIYVGVEAGNAFSTGIRNTFVGNRAGRVNTTGYFNTFVGTNAGLANTTGYFNTFIGENAGLSNTTARANTFIGRDAGKSTTVGEMNTFVGDEAGQNMVSGDENTFVGHHAGRQFTTGSGNSFFGYHAGTGTGSGSGNDNTCIGVVAGPTIFDGDDNVMIGHLSGQITSVGNNNVFVGSYSGRSTLSGSDNVFLGFRSAYQNSTGSNNIAIGRRAAQNLNLGTNSIFIGNNAEQSVAGLNNAIAIGANAVVTTQDNMILGDNTVNVGIGLSGELNGPQNKLEINFSIPGDFNTPNLGFGTGNSGLQFRDLNSHSIPYTDNPGDGVLSVDETGNVILVPDGGGSGALADFDWEHIAGVGVFSGHPNTGGFNNRAVYIGVPTAMAPSLERIVKLGVYTDYGDIGANGEFGAIAGGFRNVVVHQSLGTASKNYGVYTEAMGAGCAVDVSTNYGINAQADYAFENYAGCFKAKALGPCSQTNYGIFATCPQPVGSQTNYAGFFNGNLAYTGNFGYGSDIRLKDNIQPMQNSLTTINQLNPVSFIFRTAQYPTMAMPVGTQYGLIAQEVEPILPEIVKENIFPAQFDDNGNILSDSIHYKTIDYTKLIPHMIQAIKELSTQNQNLLNQLIQMQDMFSQCCSQQSKLLQTDVNATIQINSDASMKKTELYQNRPNPFNVKTTFAYTLGEGGNVELIVEDSSGRIVTTLVSQTQNAGEYSIDWNAEKITSGIYFYSLKVNGIVIVKKAMKL